jgi:hypothetical protein
MQSYRMIDLSSNFLIFLMMTAMIWYVTTLSTF